MNIELGCAYSEDHLYANVFETSRLCGRWLNQSPAHEGHAVIVGGGPSVADKLNVIRERQAHGQKIFALNGACRFLNEHGITPDYQVFLDANVEMSDRIGEARGYLVSSQCAPELLKALPLDRVTLWHYALPYIEDHIPEHHAEFSLVGGSTTVGLTCMNLSYGMGFRTLHLYGYDSSNRNGKDHAYEVPITEERLGDAILNSVDVTYGSRKFVSTLTMTRQAELFPEFCNRLIDAGCVVTVDVPQDTLLAAVMAEVRAANAAAAA